MAAMAARMTSGRNRHISAIASSSTPIVIQFPARLIAKTGSEALSSTTENT